MAWFRKVREPKEPREPRDRRSSKVPEGLWVKCDSCRQILYNKELARNYKICPKCGFHFRLSAAERLRMLFDGEQYTELEGELRSTDPLRFRDTKRYRDRLAEYEESIGTSDAIMIGSGTLDGIPVLIGAMEFFFLGGSMGSVVGEKVTRAAERALAERRPLIIVSTSGGARMQEGILSLMQMGKIAAALSRLSEAAVPYISVMTDPTTGGVTASYAMLGRPERRGARRAHLFRGSAGHRADDPPDPAGRLPEGRVPSRARHARLRRGALGDEGDARALPALPLGRAPLGVALRVRRR